MTTGDDIGVYNVVKLYFDKYCKYYIERVNRLLFYEELIMYPKAGDAETVHKTLKDDDLPYMHQCIFIMYVLL